jgi:hypothetical protein
MRVMLAPVLVLATLSAGAVVSIVGCIAGCDEKMGVEKRAEEIAKSASAEKAKATTEPPDPAEMKYKERKADLEKRLKAYKADQGRILSGDTNIKAGFLRPYHDDGAEADKAVKELEEKLKQDSKEGVRLKRVVEPIEIRLAGNMEDAEVELTEERASKNASACLLYVENWKFVSDKWVFKELKDLKKVDCPAP